MEMHRQRRHSVNGRLFWRLTRRRSIQSHTQEPPSLTHRLPIPKRACAESSRISLSPSQPPSIQPLNLSSPEPHGHTPCQSWSSHGITCSLHSTASARSPRLPSPLTPYSLVLFYSGSGTAPRCLQTKPSFLSLTTPQFFFIVPSHASMTHT